MYTGHHLVPPPTSTLMTEQSSPRRSRTLAVVGAGPVGCLAALAFAKLGWKVDIYEGRPDIRLPSSKASLQRRSVNLALSSRGLTALEFVDASVAANVLATAIPMKGRIIHSEEDTELQVYDPDDGQCINSVDRGLLNEKLLDAVSEHDSISIHFLHKLVTADFEKRTLIFDSTLNGAREQVEATFDLCLGADGSYSNVRRQMMRVVSMDYQQEYIPHEYIELHMPAGPPLSSASSSSQPNFLLDPNGLHIWPRHSFMLIALPNKDGSFTCTLFAPHSDLARLTDRKSIVDWFNIHFPDALKLIGEDNIVYDLSNNPRSSLISIKASPYHYKDRVVILGDAAHSMVPFYGQGLNCGLEDVRVLTSMLVSSGLNSTVLSESSPQETDATLAAVLENYTRTRHEDLVAIRDLAMYNYIEMRHDVTTLAYRTRRWVDRLLARIIPSSSTSTPLSSARSLEPFVDASGSAIRSPEDRAAAAASLAMGGQLRAFPREWLSLYKMVTFRSDIPYAVAKQKAEWQDGVVRSIGMGSVVGLGLGVGAIIWGSWRRV